MNPRVLKNSSSSSALWRLFFASLLALAALAGCGGGGSGDAPAPAPSATPGTPPAPAPAPAPTPAGANVLAVTLDAGADGQAFNSPFVNVTVCVPGTGTCQTVDHVLVDTGSFGLRLAASAVGAALPLPAVATAAGAPVAECAHFAGGFAWGSVRRADVKLGGETASSLPIQIVSDPADVYSRIPAACSNTGVNFGNNLGAKGILGVGSLNQDCPACVSSTAPATYFSCVTAGCTSTVLSLTSQVANPVPAFPADNNGVALSIPDVPAGGLATLSGTLVFGIGTQANNQLGSATVYTTDARGNFNTLYKGTSFSSFIDSGSNGLFFTDASIPQCAGFYCPPTTLSLTAVNTSSTGVSGTVSFRIESIQSIAPNVSIASVGGDIGFGNTFDWGLPFFFGRTVFVAIAGASTPNGVGPYVAY